MISHVCIPHLHIRPKLKHLQTRNLARLIWVYVAVPPADDTSKGKSSVPITTSELRKRKVKALKLCVCFAFAVKHYLRSEDGLDWADYTGILPASVVRLAQPSTSRRTSAWTSYAATEHTSRDDSAAASGDEREDECEHSSRSSSHPPVQAGSGTEVRKENADATKRIRVKRSKDKLKLPGVKSSKTPLLSGLHQTIDFHSDPDSLTTPLPLVSVLSYLP
jgi:ion channel-forming bestrophin family protein